MLSEAMTSITELTITVYNVVYCIRVCEKETLN